MAGDMTGLIRQVAEHKFFKDRVKFKNDRFEHREAAAKVLLLEKHDREGGDAVADLKKKFLDEMVKQGRTLTDSYKQQLWTRTKDELDNAVGVFQTGDPLLSKQAAIPLYYLFVKLVSREYAKRTLKRDIRDFLVKFHVIRLEELKKPEEDRNPILVDFGRLMQQGTNDANSIRTRLSYLMRYFLQFYPDVRRKDPRRAFSDDERLALLALCDGKCAECGTKLNGLSEMQADHVDEWIAGGPTSLANGRALCEACNKGRPARRKRKSE